MKLFFRSLLVICFAVFLAACATSKYAVKYTYQDPSSAEGQSCIMQCKQTRAHCSQRCRLEQSTCIAQVGEADADKCTTKCGCEYHYKSCFEMCGGRAVPQRFCIANCG